MLIKAIVVFLSLIGVTLGTPIGESGEIEPKANETELSLKNVQEKLNRWFWLLTPTSSQTETDSPDNNEISKKSENILKNETNYPYTIFETWMDPSNPENYSVPDKEDSNPFSIILSKLFRFAPEDLTYETDFSSEFVEATTPTTILSLNDVGTLPEVATIPSPPTVENETKFEKHIEEDLRLLKESEKSALKLEADLFPDDDSELEFYRQQLALIKSMEATLNELRRYFDREFKEKEMLYADRSLNNSVIIATVGIIYLLMIFAFFSFKNIFEADKTRKEEPVPPTPDEKPHVEYV